MVESLNMLTKEEYPDYIDLSENHLKNKNFQKFINNLRRTVKHLNLSNNKLGVQGTKILGDWFSDYPLMNLT